MLSSLVESRLDLHDVAICDTVSLWTCLSSLSITYYTILHIALKGIHIIMFGDEIARIRKLGVQGVSLIIHFGG